MKKTKKSEPKKTTKKCGVVSVQVSSPARKLMLMFDNVKNLTEELSEAKDNYNNACQTIAAMHEAALGERTGPIRGVVEDVADVRTQLLEAQATIQALLSESKEVRLPKYSNIDKHRYTRPFPRT